MNDEDKFLSKDNPFQKFEFDAEVDHGEYHNLSEFEQNLVYNEQEAHRREQQEYAGESGEYQEGESSPKYPYDFGGDTPYGKKNQEDWYKFFNEIFLETFDSEQSFHEITEHYTSSMLQKGIKADPHGLYNTVDQINSRISKIEIAKRIAHAHGLKDEWPQILKYELVLLYTSRESSSKNIEIHGRPVGEAK